MVEIGRLMPVHLLHIAPQPAQAEAGMWREHLASPEDLLSAGPAFSAIADGRVLACAGLAQCWPGHWLAWAVLTFGIGARMTAITRAARAVLDDIDAHRIEMLVRAGHDAGARWALMLGFEHEGRLRRYGPAAQDHDVYARVR